MDFGHLWIGGAGLAIVAPPAAVALIVGGGTAHPFALVRQRVVARSAQVALGAEERFGEGVVSTLSGPRY